MKKFVTKTVSSLAVLAAMTAAQVEAKEVKTINMAYGSANAGSLDPHFSTKSQDKNIFGMMFNGLVRFKPGDTNPANIEADLAESWTSSPDGLVWTFKLRKGVQFHTGFGEMTAEDVVYSLNRAKDPKTSAVASDYKSFKEVKALDPYTVEITLNNPVPSLLGLVANYHGGNVVSKKADMEVDFKTHPVGTGPFAFVEFKSKQYVKLAAHKDYFRGAPQVDEIVYSYVPVNTSRELAFKKGTLDAFSGTREERWVNRMSRNKNINIAVFSPGELRTLHLNTKSGPLADVRVRRAIAHAIDRKTITQIIGNSVTRPNTSVIPVGYLGHTQEVPQYDYDLEKAKALLREAGYADGVTLEIIITKNEALLKPMQIVQAQLAKANINLVMNVVEHPAFHAQIRKDLSPMVLYGAARFPVADTYLTQFYESKSTVGTPTGVTNFSHCDVADEEIQKARVETDQQKQLDYWKTAQIKISENVCSVPLFEQMQVWGISKDIEFGYEFNGSVSLGPMFNEQTTKK